MYTLPELPASQPASQPAMSQECQVSFNNTQPLPSRLSESASQPDRPPSSVSLPACQPASQPTSQPGSQRSSKPASQSSSKSLLEQHAIAAKSPQPTNQLSQPSPKGAKFPPTARSHSKVSSAIQQASQQSRKIAKFPTTTCSRSSANQLASQSSQPASLPASKPAS